MTAISSSDFDKDWELCEPIVSLGNDPHPEEIENETKHPLRDRIKLIDTRGNTSDYTVDGCLNITGPSAAFKEQRTQYWIGVQPTYGARAKWGMVAFCITGVTALFGNTYISKAGVIGMIASLAFSLYCADQHRQIFDQITRWSIPAGYLEATLRAKCYQEGFLFALFNAKDRNILHPNEIAFLYKNYSDDFCARLLAQNPSDTDGQLEWMESFLFLNPLSTALATYGLGTLRDDRKKMAEDYDQMLLEIPKELSFNQLRLKFMAFTHPIGAIGPIGPTGVFAPPSYLFHREALSVRYQIKLENMKNDYLYKIENLKNRYGKLLASLNDPSNLIDLYHLNHRFEFEARTILNSYLMNFKQLKKDYDVEFKALNERFSVSEDTTDETADKKFEEVRRVFSPKRTDKEKASMIQHYPAARVLLEQLQLMFISSP